MDKTSLYTKNEAAVETVDDTIRTGSKKNEMRSIS